MSSTGCKKNETGLMMERKKAQQYLDISGSIIVGLDLNGKVTVINQKGSDLLGYDKETIVGMDWFENFISIDDIAKIQNRFEKLKNGCLEDIEFCENYIVNNMGERKLISWHNSFIKDEAGNIVSILSSGEDITHSRKTEKKLQELIDNINDLVWEVDSNGVYTYISPKIKDILGYEVDEIIGKTPFDLMSAPEAARVGTLFQEIVKNRFPIKQLINANIDKNGKEVYLETNGQPFYDKSGKLLGYRGIDRDITERIQMEKDLREKEDIILMQSRNAAMGEMIGMIAHQWRQPLATIAMGANNILLDIELGTLNEESVKEESLAITQQTQYLSTTIDDFRNFFKPHKAKETIDITKPIEETLKVIGKSLENNNISIIKRYDTNVAITTYERELIQVFINIFKNAKEALEQKRENNRQICVEVREENDFGIIEIHDNAGGIDKDIINKVFEPYFTTKGENIGTGLGLYMSKTIIEKHMKGRIEVFNKDNGAFFRVTIPL